MTKGNVRYEDAAKFAPVVFEQVWGEKPGGGLIANPEYEVKQGTAVYADGSKFKPIKGYRLAKNHNGENASIFIEKGSGVAVGDVIGYGTKSAAVQLIVEHADMDEVQVNVSEMMLKGRVLYQAQAPSTSAAKPIGNPVYIVGNDVPAGEGDQPVRLINGANLRKETAPVAPEVVALMKNINLV